MRQNAKSGGERAHKLPLLAQALAAQRVLRKRSPKLTVAGVQLLLFVAERTQNRAELNLPTTREIREALDLKPTGVARLLETLSSGRKDRNVEGYGLLETDSLSGASRTGAWVLTDKGTECVREYLAALAGSDSVHFEPHDVGSVLKALVSRYENRPNRSK